MSEPKFKVGDKVIKVHGMYVGHIAVVVKVHPKGIQVSPDPEFFRTERNDFWSDKNWRKLNKLEQILK